MTIWETIKDRYSLRDIAAEHGVDTSKSKSVCPFCGYKRNPSFYLTDDYFRCHHCGVKGDLFTFVCLAEKMEPWDALKLLAQRAGVEIKPSPDDVAKEARSEIYRQFAEKYTLDKIQPDVALVVRKYLHDRGLTDDFIERKLIGFVPADAPDEPLLKEQGLPYLVRGRILIPFWQGRQIVYFTGRSVGDPPEGKPKFMNQKGPKQYIGTMRGPDLVITEGIFDQLLAEQAGQNCIGLAGSAGDIKLHAGIKKVILIFDNDVAGREYIEKYAMPLFQQGAEVEIGYLPEGIKDLAELLQAGRGDEIRLEGILDYYRAKVDAAGATPGPEGKAAKAQFYSILKRMDPVAREQEFKYLVKLWGVVAAVVRSDYRDYVKEVLAEEYLTEEGFKFSVPEGYHVARDGIMAGKIQISTAPIYIDKLGTNKATHEEWIRLVYGCNGSVRSRYVQKLTIAKASDFVQESLYGVPVNSSNVIFLVRWLDQWFARNRDKFGIFDVVSQLGWFKDDFVLTDRIIKRKPDDCQIQYTGAIPETAYAAKGSLKAWTDTIRQLGTLANGQTVRFLIYAGFSSAIMPQLGLRPFVIHLHGDTSEGKTTALRLVASIYGNPTEGQAMIRWNATETFIIRYMETLKNLPLVIDELSSETKRNYDSIVYQMESGLAKGKASRTDPNRTEKQRSFRMGVFSSGETLMLNEKSLGGARIRAWEFPGSPFGESNKPLIASIEKTISENYGTAIEHFLINYFRTVDFAMSDETFYTAGEIPLSNVEARMLKMLEKVWHVAHLVNEAFSLGWPVDEDLNHVFEAVRAPLNENVRSIEKIMDFLHGYYSINKAMFPHVDYSKIVQKNEVKYDGGKPPNKIAGYRFGADLGIIKTHFLEILDEHLGRNSGGHWAIDRLKEKNVIESSRERHRVEGDIVNMVYFKNFFEAEEVF
jgi:hypothetical protein